MNDLLMEEVESVSGGRMTDNISHVDRLINPLMQVGAWLGQPDLLWPRLANRLVS